MECHPRKQPGVVMSCFKMANIIYMPRPCEAIVRYDTGIRNLKLNTRFRIASRDRTSFNMSLSQLFLTTQKLFSLPMENWHWFTLVLAVSQRLLQKTMSVHRDYFPVGASQCRITKGNWGIQVQTQRKEVAPFISPTLQMVLGNLYSTTLWATAIIQHLSSCLQVVRKLTLFTLSAVKEDTVSSSAPTIYVARGRPWVLWLPQRTMRTTMTQRKLVTKIRPCGLTSGAFISFGMLIFGTKIHLMDTTAEHRPWQNTCSPKTENSGTMLQVTPTEHRLKWEGKVTLPLPHENDRAWFLKPKSQELWMDSPAWRIS